MNKTEEYNGWTNHETWAADLWLSNDEGLYNEVREIVKNSKDEWDAEKSIKEYVEELREMVDSGEAGEELKLMFNDIGSLWRVNWGEIAEAWIE